MRIAVLSMMPFFQTMSCEAWLSATKYCHGATYYCGVQSLKSARKSTVWRKRGMLSACQAKNRQALFLILAVRGIEPRFDG